MRFRKDNYIIQNSLNITSRKIAKLRSSYFYICCYDEDKLIGFLDVVSYKSTDAYIQDVMVKPAYQGKGIGTKLMNIPLSLHPISFTRAVALRFKNFLKLRNVICNVARLLIMQVGKGLIMKGIFLPGYACSSYIWEPIKNKINKNFKGKLIDWPKEKTKKYDSINDFVSWVSKEHLYGDDIDYLVGHSMGGLVSLNIAEKTNKIKRVY